VTDLTGDLVSRALNECGELAAWPLSRWDILVRQARRADLLSRIAAELEMRGILDQVPAAVRPHLEAARILAEAHESDVRREVGYVRHALARTGIDIVLLKGSAYVIGGFPPARGRLFSDIDILVPAGALAEVESALMLHGWTTTHHHPHDQRYYREWAHELPPMQHSKRLTVIDVHHGILPVTARAKPDSSRLLAACVPIPAEAGLYVLAPIDMVLHGATHLFYNEEFSHGLRDLYDLDRLLRHFGEAPRFWSELAVRAAELGLLTSLYYALRYASRIFSTPVPQAAFNAAQPGAPPQLVCSLMDALWLRVLRPGHPTAADRYSALARGALYLRAHWLRMPPMLLAYHLTAKALRRKDPAEA
jgi:hypothetical protein